MDPNCSPLIFEDTWKPILHFGRRIKWSVQEYMDNRDFFLCDKHGRVKTFDYYDDAVEYCNKLNNKEV